VVAPNLTQRRALYDDAGLTALLREGKTHDGHRAFGMPIFMFQHLSDHEVRDITAWLRALPAIENPGLAETTLTAATVQQLKDGTHPYNDDDKPDAGNRPPATRPAEPLALGRHLALTSCSECHGRDLTGWGPDDPTPSLVLVNKAYTPEHFARLMKAGIAANGKDTATGFMSRTARDRFAILDDAEIAALKLYLDSR
jgi:mono/diheme cytochrome c family protein